MHVSFTDTYMNVIYMKDICIYIGTIYVYIGISKIYMYV